MRGVRGRAPRPTSCSWSDDFIVVMVGMFDAWSCSITGRLSRMPDAVRAWTRDATALKNGARRAFETATGLVPPSGPGARRRRRTVVSRVSGCSHPLSASCLPARAAHVKRVTRKRCPHREVWQMRRSEFEVRSQD
eukprot:SAG22_NODE_18_length_32591_cov_38.043549_11_plen_136_part_00